MKFITNYKSQNFNQRKKAKNIKYIIIHYTAMTSSLEAIKYLCKKKNKVSSHFFIDKNGKIYNFVNLSKRAWHAGKSSWKKENDINSSSIGIELDNSGHHINFENYDKKQIITLSKLLILLKKLYKIKPSNILGHSDIAPYRKIDPGEKFPWSQLIKNKIITRPDVIRNNKIKIINYNLRIKLLRYNKERALYMLGEIGYDTSRAKKNIKMFRMLMKAYQMRYVSKKVSGKLDIITYLFIMRHYNQVLTS